jgi:hypothetical protein
MWLVPLLVIGVIVVAAASKSPRESRPPPRQLSPAHGASALPGPISVLGEILRVGQYPSPMVILCAIAEAEAIGRRDLAADIVSAFVAPVVYQHLAVPGRAGDALQGPASCGPVPHERGSCAPPRATSAQANYERGSCAPRCDRGSCAPRPQVSSAAAPQVAPRPATSDEILAMLHTDPSAFLAMVSSRRPPVLDVLPEAARPAVTPPPQADPSSAAPPMPLAQETPDLSAASDQASARAPGSPLGGVLDDAWRQFVACLERELPTFSSSRHVGQYRQRRERLADLGIDPSMIHGSAAAQRTALDADLADAYRHASAGGLTECLGRAIVVPGHEAPQAITLSGLLGVIQCAGLEGAAGWLERSNDRKRYPHTTQVFLNTNGVF